MPSPRSVTLPAPARMLSGAALLPAGCASPRPAELLGLMVPLPLRHAEEAVKAGAAAAGADAGAGRPRVPRGGG